MPNVLATYDRLPANTTLESFVEGQAADLARSAKRFSLIGRRQVVLDGRTGEEIVFRWDAGSGLLRQRQLCFALEDGRVITVVNTALDGEFETVDATFAAVLGSFTWL